MYLRICTLIPGPVENFFNKDELKLNGEISLEQSPAKITLSPRGVPISQLPLGYGHLILLWCNLFTVGKQEYYIVKFDIQASDYSHLITPVTEICFFDIKFNVKDLTLTFPTGQVTPAVLTDLNLPQGFINSCTQEALLAGRPTVDLLNNKDLLTLSLLSQPFYPDDFITMDYVETARHRMIDAGFVEAEEYALLDDDFNFMTKGTNNHVDVLKL